MGTTTASPLEKVPRSVGCGEASRFACSPTDRTALSFHCGHFFGITRCGGVRRSRSPDEDGLVVIWQLRTSGRSPLRIALAARLAQHHPGMALLQECRHESAPATRLIDCSDFHQACSGRAGGVVFLVRHTLSCERLTLLAPTAWRPLLSVQLHTSSQHVRGEPLQPSMAIAHAAHFASTIRRSGPAAVICDLNLHRGLWDSHTPSTTEGVDLSSTLIDMDFGLANDPAQATRITHRNASFPDVTAYRVLRVTHWQSTPAWTRTAA
ncbi:hypothetical protein TCDM_09896 [Trypanosoma cruzi Dm28c]|uniref:Endonuclease/exonuclease/phosphatase domain-containing protein n=1 Tax=Trypanosoma cruzi Dm28c TaxID=1416333 RepID=V5ANX2_TRYCR|nr:hypothetical protein TCDM_09896 [Trypanosoma cruzi Dm28c]